MKRPTNFWPYLILTGASFVVLYLIFGGALWRPNDFVFMVGGDGNVIYYNIFYHTLYGYGATLSSMNYPAPESILMTDAQSIIAMSLNKLNIVFPWVSGHVLGIVHVILMFGIWLQYIILYKVIKRLDAPLWIAILFSICIGTLAPQLVRIRYGHLGLAYPFLIPLAILWLWNIKRSHLKHTVTICFVLLTLFFGFNNPYLLVCVCILILCYGGVELLQDRFRKKKGITPLFWGFTFLILLFASTSWLDPFEDRIQHQWGHFYFASTMEGILWGKYSLLNKIIAFLGMPFVGRSEARATISLMSLVVCVVGGAYTIKAHVQGKKIPWSHRAIKLVLAAGVAFLYASAFLKSKWWFWLASDSGFITMVKATGRLSWISYYALSLLSVFIIIRLYRKLPTTLSNVVIIILGILWLVEGYIYLDQHIRLTHFTNHYALSHLEGYIQKKKEKIDFSNYQAIYTVPVFQSWNDNILTEGDWPTEVHAFAISSATGLPLINSKLSRAPVGRSLENMQMASDPLIYKTLPDKLDQSRPILLLKMNSTEHLSSGEQFLTQQSTELYTDEQLSLHELWPEDINNPNAVTQALSNCSDSWFHYKDMNSHANDYGKVGSSGIYVVNEWQEIDRIIIPDSIEGKFELSIWSKVNIEKAGMPFFEVYIFDSQEQQKAYNHYDSRNSLNNQDGWSQFQAEISVFPQDQIVIRGRGNYPMCVDELLLRPLSDGNICIQNEGGGWLINNIWVKN
ncbi:MAG: hypothetical protein ACJA01_000795 [Saprospiraceae bacterium]